MSSNYEDNRVPVRGTPLRILSAGEGRPTLVLHGIEASDGWSPLHRALAEQARVIAPEHPGFGQSKRPASLDTIEDVVHVYLDLLDALGIERADVVGHSLGGWIAAELAVRNCDRIRRLVLIDPLGIRQPDPELPDFFMCYPEQQRELMVHDPALATTLPQAEPTIYVRNLAMLAQLGWNPRFCNPKLEGRLHRITVPTLIIWGADDRIAPIGQAERWHRSIATSGLTVIPRSGHLPQYEQPEALTAAVCSFLEDE